MHETLAQSRWSYYYDGKNYYPSSSQLSVKWVSDIIIYSSITAGDVNRDGLVDNYDLHALGRAYNSTPTTANWNPNADFTNDDVVDSADLIILQRNYGKSSA
jgi:YHS domain-containing protein